MLRKTALMTKATVALLVGVALVYVSYPAVSTELAEPQPDQGNRPLIVVAANSGSVKVKMRVEVTVKVDGNLEFRAYVRGEPPQGTDRSSTNVQVLIAGEGVESKVSCGEDGTAQRAVTPEDLPAGPRRAYETDSESGRVSVTNWPSQSDSDADSTPGAEATAAPSSEELPSAHPEMVYVSSGLWQWHDGERIQDGPGGTINCTIDRSLVWRTTNAQDPLGASDSTLLVPEIDFTPIDQRWDSEMITLRAELDVQRPEGATLTDSYPAPDHVNSLNWGHTFGLQWRSQDADPGGWFYSIPPAWRFNDRDAQQDEQRGLLFGGMGLSLAAALIVRSFSDYVDAFIKEDSRNAGAPAPK